MLKMFTVNKDLIAAKAHYFSFFGAIGGVVPFVVRIAMQFGASPSVVGYMYSSLPFIMLLGKGIFGAIADKYQQKKSLLIASVAVTISAFFVIDFIPSVWDSSVSATAERCDYAQRVHVRCSYDQTNHSRNNCILNCSLRDGFDANACINTTDNCIFVNISSPANDASSSAANWGTLRDNCYDINHDYQLKTESLCNDDVRMRCNVTCHFLTNITNEPRDEAVTSGINHKVISLWVCMAIANVGLGVGVSLSDTVILDLLEKKENFGRERLWGAVGWGLFSLITGLIIDWFSQDESNLNFTPGMYVLLVLGIVDVIIISFKISVKKTEKPKKMARNVGKVFLNPEVAVFTLSVFIVGCLTSVLWTFLIVYLNDLGASQLLIGLTMAVQCFLGEIPFFFISNWFLKRLGHGHSMTLVLVIFSFRLICYSFINNPWLVLPIELTQGITYSIFFTSLATYANSIAHPSIQSSVQSILQGMFEGLGVGVGSVVSGIAYEYFGSTKFFLFTGILAGGLACIIGIIQCFLLRKGSSKSSDQIKGESNIENDILNEDNAIELSKMIEDKESSKNQNGSV